MFQKAEILMCSPHLLESLHSISPLFSNGITMISMKNPHQKRQFPLFFYNMFDGRKLKTFNLSHLSPIILPQSDIQW
jgi:hypothetical protein